MAIFNNPINMCDETGTWPSWATKVVIGTITLASKGVYINKIGRLKTTKNTGKGYEGIRVGIQKGNSISYRSYEIHSPHVGTKHNVWHFQINTWSKHNNIWSKHNNIWSISNKKAKHYLLVG